MCAIGVGVVVAASVVVVVALVVYASAKCWFPLSALFSKLQQYPLSLTKSTHIKTVARQNCRTLRPRLPGPYGSQLRILLCATLRTVHDVDVEQAQRYFPAAHRSVAERRRARNCLYGG